jgi:hypothetical protein
MQDVFELFIASYPRPVQVIALSCAELSHQNFLAPGKWLTPHPG